MTEEEEQELMETVRTMDNADRAFVLACITGEGFDEALAELKKVRGVEDD